MRSRWNATPAGRAALNTVAAYNSYLTTVPALGTTQPLRDLVSGGCVQCTDDIRNAAQIIAAGQSYASPTGDIRSRSVALYVEWRSGSQYMIRADAAEPSFQILNRSGKVISEGGPSVLATESVVETAGGAARILRYSNVSR